MAAAVSIAGAAVPDTDTDADTDADATSSKKGTYLAPFNPSMPSVVEAAIELLALKVDTHARAHRQTDR